MGNSTKSACHSNNVRNQNKKHQIKPKQQSELVAFDLFFTVAAAFICSCKYREQSSSYYGRSMHSTQTAPCKIIQMRIEWKSARMRQQCDQKSTVKSRLSSFLSALCNWTHFSSEQQIFTWNYSFIRWDCLRLHLLKLTFHKIVRAQYCETA